MPIYLSKHFARFAVAAACLIATVGDGTAASFTRTCAARDLQILMLIEAHQSADAVSTQKLNDAMLTMTHARMICHQGQVVDALAIYDTIAQALTSDSILFRRIK